MKNDLMPSSTTGAAAAAHEAAVEEVAKTQAALAPDDSAGAATNGAPVATNGVGAGLMTLREIRREPRVRVYISKANEQMAAIGFTEHGHRHAGIVATISRSILTQLGVPERPSELAAIAGYLHDIGCVVNRQDHVVAGGLISFQILSSLNMDPMEIADIVGAVGNHEEPHGVPISPIVAAVIIADKSDVHFSRVQNANPADYDIHDKVNGAVRKSYLRVEPEAKIIRLELEIDTEAATLMEYFEIFITRMTLCRRSARVLGCDFRLSINGRDL